MAAGSMDFSQLRAFNARLQRLTDEQLDQMYRRVANQVAARLLAKVKRRTPVGVVPRDIYTGKSRKVVDRRTGRRKPSKEATIFQRYWAGYTGGSLRDGWSILPIEKEGNDYLVTVINNLQYASYVEYGHRQTPGRYVPALGKRLTSAWVPGKFMLRISEQEVETAIPRLLSSAIEDALRGAAGGP